jgi:hypothetical protein
MFEVNWVISVNRDMGLFMIVFYFKVVVVP